MATIKIVLRNKPNINNEYPIVLRVVKNRESKIITLGFRTLKKDWDEINNVFKKGHPNHNQRNRLLLQCKQKALEIIDEFMLNDLDFTLSQFEDVFRGKSGRDVSVSDFWKEKILDLNTAGRTGNARAYKDTYNSFFRFQGNKKLLFREITPVMLDKYETFLRGNGNTDGGIGVKMREIRALYNDAIKKGVVEEKYYPFKAFKVSRFKSKGIKKALTKEDIRKMESIDLIKYPHLLHTRNLMVFSYYVGGMNFVDMMKLQWGNIKGDRVEYVRSKTKGTIRFRLLQPAREVLEYYMSKEGKAPYIFPVIEEKGLTPIQIENKKLKSLKKFNKELKEIAKLVGVKESVTSYTIRHSYATNLKHLGVSADIIGESMGHKDVSVTTAYLKHFEDEMIDSEIEKLLWE